MLSEQLTAPAGAGALDPAAQQAIEWEVRLRAGEVRQRDREQFEAWRRADPAHDAAWTRLQERLGKLSALRDASGAAVRQALNEPSHTRRRVLKAGAGIAALAMAGVGTRELVKVFSLDADYRNRGLAPEHIALNDGMPITLGASARVYTTAGAPPGGICLASGEIATSAAAARGRPWIVKTRDGMARTSDAWLSVEALRSHTIVAVRGGDAMLATASGNSVRAPEGSAWSLSSRHAVPMPETAADIFAWTRGTLVVLDRPLPDILETLGRYYSGYIRFPEAALARRVSGVFPLNEPEAALHQLAEGLGLSLSLYGKVLAVASET